MCSVTALMAGLLWSLPPLARTFILTDHSWLPGATCLLFTHQKKREKKQTEWQAPDNGTFPRHPHLASPQSHQPRLCHMTTPRARLAEKRKLFFVLLSDFLARHIVSLSQIFFFYDWRIQREWIFGGQLSFYHNILPLKLSSYFTIFIAFIITQLCTYLLVVFSLV